MKEEFKNIEGYPSYKVSNLGRVKSFKYDKERLLKPSTTKSGYLNVVLCEGGKTTSIRVHQLVAIAFLNHKQVGYGLVVNHINFNTLDNDVKNLEITTQRENTNKKHISGTSKYIGVSWRKSSNKWVSQIQINGTPKHLGLFDNELDASEAYHKALNLYLCNS
jgi:hypothetical protein